MNRRIFGLGANLARRLRPHQQQGLGACVGDNEVRDAILIEVADDDVNGARAREERNAIDETSVAI